MALFTLLYLAGHNDERNWWMFTVFLWVTYLAVGAGIAYGLYRLFRLSPAPGGAGTTSWWKQNHMAVICVVFILVILSGVSCLVKDYAKNYTQDELSNSGPVVNLSSCSQIPVRDGEFVVTAQPGEWTETFCVPNGVHVKWNAVNENARYTLRLQGDKRYLQSPDPNENQSVTKGTPIDQMAFRSETGEREKITITVTKNK